MKTNHPTDHQRYERTLIILKPDGLQRSLAGEIIKRYEQVGMKLVAMKLLVPTAEIVEKHYTLNPEWRLETGVKTIKSYTDRGAMPPETDPLKVTEKILKNLVRYMTSGPVIAMVWQGAHVVDIVRKITGGTEPLTSDVGTIRGDYVHDSYRMTDQDGRSVRNLVHASASVAEAEEEIAHWFRKEEIVAYKHVQEAILYDVNLDGILE